MQPTKLFRNVVQGIDRVSDTLARKLLEAHALLRPSIVSGQDSGASNNTVLLCASLPTLLLSQQPHRPAQGYDE